MKTILLKKLTLRDFQGGNFVLDIPEGKDVSVWGENASGKTRLVSGFMWLLFNKDAMNRSDFELKNLNSQGEPTHGLEHTVEADFDVNNQIVNLKKVFQEKWQKKRGSTNREFTGHTTSYFIDGVPIQEKDYISQIADIAGDESRFRLLTSPTTFPQLHWQKQRQLLLDICGDISDADIIASDEKLFPLLKILGKRTLDDHRKIVTARRSEINKEMEKIPVRIDEVRRGFPDVAGINRGESEKEAQRLETALNDAKLRLQGVNTGGNIADFTKKLSGLNADLRKMEDAHRSGSLATLNRLNQEISETRNAITGLRRNADSLYGEITQKEASLKRLEPELSRLREKWVVIDAETFKDTISNTCPTCNQALPVERIQEARDKALADFNLSKAEKLGDIDRKGKDLRGQRDQLNEEIETIKKGREIVLSTIPDTEEKLRNITQQYDTLKSNSEDFSTLPNRADLLDEIEDIDLQIKAEREGRRHTREEIEDEVGDWGRKLTVAKQVYDRFTQREQGERRIEDLKVTEKTLSAEFEKLEGELYLCDLFVRQKVSMLTTKINEKFETVRFKLFDLQVNGALAECCQITVGGVPFDGGLNNGARINAGLEIVKVLQEHYNLKAPVFADNAEAVNKLVDVGCQMIRLYVSDDKQLRIEFKE